MTEMELAKSIVKERDGGLPADVRCMKQKVGNMLLTLSAIDRMGYTIVPTEPSKAVKDVALRFAVLNNINIIKLYKAMVKAVKPVEDKVEGVDRFVDADNRLANNFKAAADLKPLIEDDEWQS